MDLGSRKNFHRLTPTYVTRGTWLCADSYRGEGHPCCYWRKQMRLLLEKPSEMSIGRKWDVQGRQQASDNYPQAGGIQVPDINVLTSHVPLRRQPQCLSSQDHQKITYKTTDRRKILANIASLKRHSLKQCFLSRNPEGAKSIQNCRKSQEMMFAIVWCQSAAWWMFQIFSSVSCSGRGGNLSLSWFIPACLSAHSTFLPLDLPSLIPRHFFCTSFLCSFPPLLFERERKRGNLRNRIACQVIAHNGDEVKVKDASEA